MRRIQTTVSRRSLQAEVEHELWALVPWKNYGRKVTGQFLVQLLALMTVLRSSWSAALQRCPRSVSWETLRKALQANLPTTQALLVQLPVRLQARLPRRLRRGRRRIAIDLHERCYYGDVPKTPGVRGGRRKAGTKWFWTYATACLVEDGERWTIAATTVHTGEPMEVIVARLLEQIRPSGLRIGRLLLDRGFYSAKVVALLQEQRVPFLMPVIRRGKGKRGTARFFRRSMRGWFTYTWESRDRKNGKAPGPTVTVQIACVPARKGRKGPWVYAYGGSFGSLANVRQAYRWFRQTYRGRFGIEASYRQLGEALGQTTSRCEAYRLLLVAVALLLRNLWVWCQQLGLSGCTFNRLLDECRLTLVEQLGYVSVWETQTVIPSCGYSK